jgi:hypothetical protein
MAAINNILFFVLVLLAPCLSQTITARAQLPYEEPLGLQDELSLAQDLGPLNATMIDQLNNVGFPSSSPNLNRIPRGIWAPIKKRNNYCFPSETTAYCIDSNLCCTNTASNTGWCFWFTLSCGTLGGCITPV